MPRCYEEIMNLKGVVYDKFFKSIDDEDVAIFVIISKVTCNNAQYKGDRTYSRRTYVPPVLEAYRAYIIRNVKKNCSLYTR